MNVRLLRGQVVVREITERSDLVWTPEEGQRQVKTHRGIVLALGPPALLGNAEVPHGFQVGDVVQYHFSRHHKEAHTMPWPPDGEPATWIPQSEIDGVWES